MHVQTKIASIGQAIMQAARPRVLLAPLQVGLGVQLHHHFASHFLIDSLHNYGFCCMLLVGQEVHHFERNAAISHGTDIPILHPSLFSMLQTMWITTSEHWMVPRYGNDSCHNSWNQEKHTHLDHLGQHGLE